MEHEEIDGREEEREHCTSANETSSTRKDGRLNGGRNGREMDGESGERKKREEDKEGTRNRERRTQRGREGERVFR